MNLPALSAEMQQSFLNERVIVETIDRITKDLATVDIQIQIEAPFVDVYPRLMHQLIPELEKLMLRNKQTFMQLLYKIDISEQKLNSELNAHPDQAYPELLSRLIIERELQKVLTRMYYSTKKK